MSEPVKANDWLVLFLWMFDRLINPTPRNLLESFEAWNYRNRLGYELSQLYRSKMLERQSRHRGAPWRLTERGRLTAMGGIDPALRWSRHWDGRWRLLLFDLPARQQRLRTNLWRWLRRQRFGYLQQSVWIVPDAINEADIPLRHLKLTPESLTVIEGAPAPPGSNESIVHSAWDFALINRNYTEAIKVAITGRKFVHGGRPAEMRQWLADERAVWTEAVASDPLLPDVLLPKNYLGQKALREHQKTFLLLSQALAQ